MNSSFLYHAWGLYHHKCLREEDKGNTIILHVESKRGPKCCPQCGHAHLGKNGFHTRDFISLPIGGKKVILRMKARRYKCKCADCDYDCQERISFAPGSHSYTRRFARYVVDLLKGMTLKDTAHLLSVSWDKIKEIHTHHLECRYAPPSLEGVDSIGIDEFAVRKGHVYKTIVVDLRAVGFPMWVRARQPMLWPDFGKESDERSSTSSISPPIPLPLSSPPYLKTARTWCMSSTIFMWSN